VVQIRHADANNTQFNFERSTGRLHALIQVCGGREKRDGEGKVMEGGWIVQWNRNGERTGVNSLGRLHCPWKLKRNWIEFQSASSFWLQVWLSRSTCEHVHMQLVEHFMYYSSVSLSNCRSGVELFHLAHLSCSAINGFEWQWFTMFELVYIIPSLCLLNLLNFSHVAAPDESSFYYYYYYYNVMQCLLAAWLNS